MKAAPFNSDLTDTNQRLWNSKPIQLTAPHHTIILHLLCICTTKKFHQNCKCCKRYCFHRNWLLGLKARNCRKSWETVCFHKISSSRGWENLDEHGGGLISNNHNIKLRIRAGWNLSSKLFFIDLYWLAPLSSLSLLCKWGALLLPLLEGLCCNIPRTWSANIVFSRFKAARWSHQWSI